MMLQMTTNTMIAIPSESRRGTYIISGTIVGGGGVVTAISANGDHEAVVLDLDEQRAVRLLAAAGLLPTLRHREAV